MPPRDQDHQGDPRGVERDRGAAGLTAAIVPRLLIRADGAARGNPGPAAAGAVLIDATRPDASDPDAPPVAVIARPLGRQTNNVAEYAAVVFALEKAAELGAREVELVLDSKLVVEQLSGRWRLREPKLRQLHAEARDLLGRLDRWSILHEPRTRNRAADALANLALDDPAAALAVEARRIPLRVPDPTAGVGPRDERGSFAIEGLHRIWVHCRDLARSAAFYEGSLGLRRQWEVEAPALVGLRVGTADGIRSAGYRTELMLAACDAVEASRHLGITLEVRGIDALVEQLRAAGNPVAQEPADRPWGVRDAAVLDPDGHELWFVEPLEGGVRVARRGDEFA